MRKNPILSTAIAAALSTTLVAAATTPILAADTSPKDSDTPVAEQATNKAAEEDLIKVSDDAMASVRDLHSARLAIFNGEPEHARTFADAAATRITAAATEAENYALDIKAPKGNDMYVPFDAGMVVADTYVPSEASAKHIAKANEHLHKGEQKAAIEALKLGEIDVAVATSLLPVNFAKEHIDDAAKLIGEGKYYEANLALKAVDDAVVEETFAVDAVPATKKTQ